MLLLSGGRVRRVVQPDLLVLTREKSHLAASGARAVGGPPDLVVEIISPSDQRRDRELKRRWYAEAGVREYWLVDRETRSIEAPVLEDGAYRTHVRAAGDDLVTSTVLPDLSFPASTAFS